MLYGYAGTILEVNLTSGRATKTPLPENLAREYIGGRGFVARLLWERLSRGTNPFDPENLIIIATGPLSGHLVPASGKTHFGTKSPATGGYADSNMGGHFGPALKYAGYDVLLLTGRAPRPTYLFIEDETVELRSAEPWWGQGAITSEEGLKNELGDEFRAITIGPAGENLVRFACISHDFGRQAGRAGVGAVMGSKNLKAIAVKGTGGLPVFDVEGLFKKSREAYEKVKAKPGFTGWTPEGTAGITDWVNEVGAFPTRNFQTSFFPGYKNINGRAVVEHLKITDKGCFCCPTPCGKYGKAKTGLGEVYVEGPEYESIAILGGDCTLGSIEEVAYANYVCDELGLDTISAGGVAAWAMECFEKGIISEEQVGREIRFGDLDSVVYLLEKMAAREGIGDLLAEGVMRASAKLGHGSEEFAMHVKGLEWTGYESRNAPGMMLAYMTADIGAHHNRAWALGHDVAGSAASVHDLISAGGSKGKLAKATVAGKAGRVIELQHIRPLFDCLGVCRLQYMELGFEVENYEELFFRVTGRKMSWNELLEVSERVWHLTRAFSIREVEGFGRESDYPPPRFFQEPIPDGPNEGHYLSREELDILLDEYYAGRGWDKDGIPTEETLRRVGLGDVAEQLAPGR
ncbi:MAG: aldehyde ferredoxin oxidoreductase [Deltaproteobacteria bacterium]|nr:MAG: aldehyde ferredoxin oxidoreductase [Deltaproteobacteria bacterium]